MKPRPIFNGRAQVLVGDTTSHGGVVLSGSPNTLINGHPVARIGDTVTCPLCKPHTFKIVEGYTPFTDNNMAIALHGHKTACGATLIASAKGAEMPKTPAPAPKSPTTPYSKELGPDADKLAAESPTLSKDLQTLKKEGWTVEYGKAGDGSYATRGTKTITLDSNLKGNPKELTKILSHETGHAMHPFRPNLSSKESYIKDALDDEGAAVMKNIKVQREIIKSSNIDIGIAGQPKNLSTYTKAYDQFLKDGDYKSAIRKIGNEFRSGEFTSTTMETYGDFHGKWYDDVYLPWCEKNCNW